MKYYMKYIKMFESFQNILIGKGSSRKIYDNGNDTVIKKAYKPIGLFQNENEIFLSKQDDINNILNKVIDYSDDYSWILVKKVELINDIDIENHIKNFSVLENYLNNSYITEEQKHSLDENIFVQKLKILVNKYNLNYMDLSKHDNYGLLNNKLVLIDYGLTTLYNMAKYEDMYKSLLQ